MDREPGKDDATARGARPPRSRGGREPRVLAVASGGGHWIQLKQLGPAFERCELAYACTMLDEQAAREADRWFSLPDANARQKLRLLQLCFVAALVILRYRPDVVVTTGAAPGLITLVFGRLLGARTVWIDSLANAERLSLSGRLARPFASLWLTQWRHLAGPKGPAYRGAVL